MPSQEVADGDAVEESPPNPPVVSVALPGKEKKKGPCFAWRNGNCKHGDKCQWRHDGTPGQPKELTEVEKKEIVAKRSKMPCNGYAAGHCRFGDKCQFMHSPDKKPSAAGACTTVNQDDDADGGLLVFTAPATSASEENADHHARDEDVEVSMPAKAIKEWILDTGTENHLISADRCCEEEDDIVEAERPLRLATANGEIVADKRVSKRVGALGTTIDLLVLDHTVEAISVGRLVLEGEFSFHWPNGESAYLVDKSGKKTVCETKGFVPVIKHLRDDGGDDETFCRPCALPGVGSAQNDEGEEQGEDERKDDDGIPVSHYLIHRPKKDDCWACQLAKMTAKPARRIDPRDRKLDPTVFGEHVCADHVILQNAKSMGMSGERAALFIMDMYTRLPDLVPLKDKSAEEATRAIKYYLGDAMLGRLYTDNSKELIAAGRELDAVHQTATPHRPQTNAFAERSIRTMLEGARTALLQAGLPPRFWPLAAKHHSFATAVSSHADGLPSSVLHQARRGVRGMEVAVREPRTLQAVTAYRQGSGEVRASCDARHLPRMAS